MCRPCGAKSLNIAPSKKFTQYAHPASKLRVNLSSNFDWFSTEKLNIKNNIVKWLDEAGIETSDVRL